MQQPMPPNVELIPVDMVTVINPRARNKKNFKDIISNIAQIGLKRPITVTRRTEAEGSGYNLVCGQGRLEAFRTLGQRDIPAIVIEADKETALVMSLVENLARRQHQALDLLHDIRGMKQRGYKDGDIARKTGLTQEYVRGVIRLLETGENRLLRAVESGQIPVSIAVEIAETDDADMQRVLQQAYEKKLLRGHRLIQAKRLVEQRRRRGKGAANSSRPRQAALTSTSLLRTYQQDAEKKKLLVRKAQATSDQLVFVTEAMRKLFADDHFMTLLRAEDLETLPRNLAERLLATERHKE